MKTTFNNTRSEVRMSSSLSSFKSSKRILWSRYRNYN